MKNLILVLLVLTFPVMGYVLKFYDFKGLLIVFGSMLIAGVVVHFSKNIILKLFNTR